MKAIIAAGGTGGHIIPALAIAKQLQTKNIQLLYIGNLNSMEQSLAQSQGLPFVGLNVQKLYRRLTIKHLKFPLLLLSSVIKSYRAIKRFKPDFFIGCGGFVSGPPGFAARLAGVDIYLQEQNSWPGITTRLLAGKAKRIFTGFQQVSKLNPANCMYSGNPINPVVSVPNKQAYLSQLGLDPTKKTLLVTGGSQGAAAVNNAVAQALPQLLQQGYQLLWQAGKTGLSTYAKYRQPGVVVFDFSTDFASYMAVSDMAIARAGALTLAELETHKIPAVLVPLPSAAENHQYYNALKVQQKGQALLVEQKDLTSTSLLNAVSQLGQNLAKLKASFGSSPHQSAAQTIVNSILADRSNND